MGLCTSVIPVPLSLVPVRGKGGRGHHYPPMSAICQLPVGRAWPFLPAPLSPEGGMGASLPVGTGLT